MKIRNGFVSNSSSSSFIINKKYLSDEQITSIYHHIDVARDIPDIDIRNSIYDYDNDDNLVYESSWDISQHDNFIIAHSFMPNFDMERFLEFLEIPKKAITRDDDPYGLAYAYMEEHNESIPDEDELTKTETCDSSLIHGYQYFDNRKTLLIRFNNDDLYIYFDVPEQIVSDWNKAESVGKFFNQRIRNIYKYNKINI